MIKPYRNTLIIHARAPGFDRFASEPVTFE